jgi:hypothetical protein
LAADDSVAAKDERRREAPQLQAPPEQAMLHSAPDSHDWLQRPPEQLTVHDEPASHT